jgi:hypothetical protein
VAAGDPEVIRGLVRLMTGDAALSDFGPEQLADAARALQRPRELEGRIAAELYEVHHWTWEQVAALFRTQQGKPVALSTVHRWAEPYRKKNREGGSDEVR